VVIGGKRGTHSIPKSRVVWWGGELPERGEEIREGEEQPPARLQENQRPGKKKLTTPQNYDRKRRHMFGDGEWHLKSEWVRESGGPGGGEHGVGFSSKVWPKKARQDSRGEGGGGVGCWGPIHQVSGSFVLTARNQTGLTAPKVGVGKGEPNSSQKAKVT